MIKIVSFGNVNRGILEDICAGVRKIFSMPCDISKDVLGVPESAYDKRRKQYCADPFLKSLQDYSKNSENGKILGITTEDLFTQNLNFIFGQAYFNGKVCIISLHRLEPVFYGDKEEYSLIIERAVKEAVHEIGHCLGLTHCSDNRCAMVFSNDICGVDEKTTGFCKSCEEKI